MISEAETAYAGQHRGGDDSYAAYYAAMDATMRQKVALCAAHFLLDPGARIADMGCGSGLGTFSFASLNPQARVIGVDINPDSVRIASEQYRLPNLEYRVGDCAERLFENEPVDGILNSSTMHHVYSFNGYDAGPVRRALANHLDDLTVGGILVVRDFCVPEAPDHVLLSLPDDALPGQGWDGFSAAELLRSFARTARPLDERAGPGFFLEEVGPADADPAGWRRFRLEHHWAAEFLLRKDYRADWEVERLEQYAFFTPRQWIDAISGLGARVLHAAPVHNPWIVRNRFEGQALLRAENGAALPWPATNFVAVAQKVAPGASLRLRERRPADAKASFLSFSGHREIATGTTWDLVARRTTVLDVFPWRRDAEGRVRVAARHGYPRPILNAVPRGTANLDGVLRSGHIIEPIALPDEGGLGRAAQRAGIDPVAFARALDGLRYFPSPGGIAESVRSVFVELDRPIVARPAGSHSGFSTSGETREFDAQELLRAAQVGMLPEARLELNVARLLRRLGVALEPWIGEPVLPEPAEPEARLDLDSWLGAPSRQVFAPEAKSSGFLRHQRSVFVDETVEDGLPRRLAEQELEFVLPEATSANTVAVLPVVRAPDGTVLVAVEERDLPAPQELAGDSRILCAPAWRLPRAVEDAAALRAFLSERAAHAVFTPLGSAYCPSAGLTPERVFPFAATGPAAPWEALGYGFVPLREILRLAPSLRDGHLLILAHRLAHALGE